MCHRVAKVSDSQILAALARIEGAQGELRAGVTDLRADVSELRAGVTDLRADVSDLRAGVTDLRADVSDLRAGVTDLRADVSDLQTGQAGLQAGQDALREELRKVRTDFLAELGSTRTIMMERFQQLRSDTTVAFGRADAAHRYGEHTRDELRDLSKVITPIIERIKWHEERMDRMEGRLDGWSTPKT
jgi:chromosome segregation ATPase